MLKGQRRAKAGGRFTRIMCGRGDAFFTFLADGGVQRKVSILATLPAPLLTHYGSEAFFDDLCATVLAFHGLTNWRAEANIHISREAAADVGTDMVNDVRALCTYWSIALERVAEHHGARYDCDSILSIEFRFDERHGSVIPRDVYAARARFVDLVSVMPKRIPGLAPAWLQTLLDESGAA